VIQGIAPGPTRQFQTTDLAALSRNDAEGDPPGRLTPTEDHETGRFAFVERPRGPGSREAGPGRGGSTQKLRRVAPPYPRSTEGPHEVGSTVARPTLARPWRALELGAQRPSVKILDASVRKFFLSDPLRGWRRAPRAWGVVPTGDRVPVTPGLGRRFVREKKRLLTFCEVSR
jgi:hypothetical protein